MDAPADLIDLARADLQSAIDLAARSGVGSLEACSGSLARSAQRLEAAVAWLTTHPVSRGLDAQLALERFQEDLRIYAALQRNAGTFCAEWGRALRGLGGQAYSPAGGGGLPALVSGGRRVSVEA